jgi:hypothetical protein
MGSSRTRKRFMRTLTGSLSAVTGLFCSVAMAAAAPRAYIGTTSQHLPIVVKLSETQLQFATYKARFTCTKKGHSPVAAVGVTRLPSTHITHSKIDKRFHLLHGTDLTLLVAAAQNGSLSGGFREIYMSQAGYFCDSGTVYFKLGRQ